MVWMRSTRVPTHLSAADSTLMAHRPMARTAFLTKSTSTSVEYLLQSGGEGKEGRDSEEKKWAGKIKGKKIRKETEKGN